MPSLKEALIKFVKQLPDAASLDDIISAINHEKQAITRIAEGSADPEITELVRLAGHSLKDFLEAEPDIYSDADLVGSR